MKKKIRKTVGKMPPTLLVGLGGTGSEIVGKVYDLANDEQKKFLQFVFLDTDANELRERKFMAPEAHTVQTSRKITVGQALRDDPEAFNNTFPINPQLMNKPLTEGAGQIRAVSKLAFDMCVREGRLNGLHEAVNALQKLNGDDMEQSIRVLIVSTLVGGTGSGILLPVSMYLRNYLETVCNKKPIIRAFCLLPEVFFTGDQKTEVEKSNLRTNAYATLRELDAFMLRADSAPDSEIRQRFTLKMPRPGTVGQYDEYDRNPLDYCFLFDAQNINGETLNDLQAYKRHAADCIYAACISRLHKRLNSSEDNTILERCAENGRNRYCGTGTAKLIYPFAAMRDYVALNWMSQAMTDDWLRYDKKVEKEKIKQQKRRAKGIVSPPIDEREAYCEAVKSDFANNNYFGFAITEECYSLDKTGSFFTVPRWQSFYSELKAALAEMTEDAVESENIEALISSMNSDLDKKKIGNFKGNYSMLEQMMKVLFVQTKKTAESKASITADSMFSIDNYDATNPKRLEYWLIKNDVPLHPNSVRYFLYMLEKEMRDDLRKLDTPVDDRNEVSAPEQGDGIGIGAEEQADIFEDIEFSFPEIKKMVTEFFTTEDYRLDSAKGSSNRNVNLTRHVQSLNVKNTANFVSNGQKVLRTCQDYVDNVKQYYKIFLLHTVLEQAISFIDNLCKNYEYFYRVLDNEIEALSFRSGRIQSNYINNPGNPVIYVCASQHCFSSVLEDCPNVIDPIQLTNEFRTDIFEAIYKNADADADFRALQQKQTIKRLVSKDILDFWRDAVLDQYSEKVDMDIIEAILKEAEYEEGIVDVAEQVRYVDKKYREARTLSAPFIDKPVGQPYEIFACGMSSAIAEPDNLAKTEMLKVFGHYEPDSLMDRYQILVMTALYNLKASDLKKFASADYHPADPRVDGSYFKDYVARVDNILPDSAKSNVITPHLDRRWHFAGVLPDFEDKTEEYRQSQAQKAFLIAFAYRYIRFNRNQYKFVGANGDFMDEQIVVQDGLCDKLHEVYEALNISRPLVRDFLDRFDNRTQNEKEVNGIANFDYTHSDLYKAINEMNLVKYDFIPKVSYLELPLLYKTSVGNGSFKDSDAIVMLHNFIKVTEDYLAVFYEDNIRRTEYFVQWLDEQTQRMFENVTTYYNLEGKVIIQDIVHDSLFERIVNNIIGKFTALEFVSDKAAECVDKYTKLWNELTKKN